MRRRQARYRANHVAGGPKLRYRKPADRRSRPQRWDDAVAELTELQAEYQTWLDALPEKSGGHHDSGPLAHNLRTRPAGTGECRTPAWLRTRLTTLL